MKDLLIAGVDEVGRGCLAGPVIAAVVILDPANPVLGLADSKSLSASRRAQLSAEIRAKSLVWSLGRAEPGEIDRINILQASLLAMARAARSGLAGLQSVWVRVDGAHCPDIGFPCEAVIRGDRSVAEISAASILAKVYRDSEMMLLDQICPGYGFGKNKGYPTREHLEGLQRHGPTRFHRRSFAPVREGLRNEDFDWAGIGIEDSG
ncbi:MAG: ribonuclease HII [Methylococcales bacterium]